MTSQRGYADPLKIDLQRQTQKLLEQLPSTSPARITLANVITRTHLLVTLSSLLAYPSLTIPVAIVFRPLLLDLCSRWLLDAERLDDKLEAFGLLIEIHPELFPILSVFLRRPEYLNGLLSFVSDTDDLSSIDTHRLHRILLAYYRILRANRDIPRNLGWSTHPLSRLIWASHPDCGVRFLASRCYALQSGLSEGERVKIEKEAIGEVSSVDFHVYCGENVDGTRIVVDGWILPTVEVTRIYDTRITHLESQDYYSLEDSIEPIHHAELSPYITHIYGVLMFRRSTNSKIHHTDLIATPTAIDSLRNLALHLSLNIPILVTSSPSAGKSTLLYHLASRLYPGTESKIITIYLADTSLDARSLLGSYVTSTTRPGTFEWKEGVLVRAMREGKWVVFKDIDKASNEVLGLIKPLVESLGHDKWIGGRASLDISNRGPVEAHEDFMIFATRSASPSRGGGFPSPTFYGPHKFNEVVIASPTLEDLRMIVNERYSKLAGNVSEGLIRIWDAVRSLGTISSTRDVGLRELEKLCSRVNNLLPATYQAMDMDIDTNSLHETLLPSVLPNTSLREDIFFETRDVFFGSGGTTSSAKAHLDSIAAVIAEHLGLTPERRDWVLRSKIPEYHIEKDVNGVVTSVRLGRTRLHANSSQVNVGLPVSRPFAMHKPAVLLMSRIATAVSLGEPILLTGETGTGKTSVVSHLASLLRKPLISLNLSNQTESSDIIGGFKPVDTRVPAAELQGRFLELFGGTFSRKRNATFEEGVRKAVQEGKWKRAVALWLESARLAKERIKAKMAEDQSQIEREGEAPRKRRKTGDGGLNVSQATWEDFEEDVRIFEIQHIQGNGKFAFGFVEGPLVKALRSGHWILLDEVNLASAETLECISGLLQGPTASITLTEQGSLEPVPRHPDFRLFACMNPATDVGKKDLPPNIRSRFSEIDVPPPDADMETLLSIVEQYIGPYTVGDRGAVMDVAEFYTAVRKLAESRKIADGSNHRPHFSMRTLARALTFVADVAGSYPLRRALWEGCLMAFTMILDKPSSAMVTGLAQKHILAGVRNPRSLLTKDPAPPREPGRFVKFGPFHLERGPLPEDLAEDYIMTPSVENKLIDLARIIVTRRFPVLIEGPTSSGKTSSIEHLARRTGHRFVRINNHEHTDIQEYLGTYVSDPSTGKLVFKDGLLVRALRNGDWIVLDELNLAPTDVLEALNRLLDDNRELVIPETQEVVRPHPHFLLFATQNPPGLYAGRKVLSRAFRNRFLEVHFEDVPQDELETILCQRCRIAPSYGKRIVAVFEELQRRRQSSRIFESKQGFATLRDLFRWAGRDAVSYQELAENGYMLLAERTRRSEDKAVVKEVLESIMKVRIDEARLYNLFDPERHLTSYLGCPLPTSSNLVWTSAMQRLFVLLSRALRFNEPVLLVGETGCGKTSVCQVFAQALTKELHTVSCHQNTETADLIGGLRPVRNRAANEEVVIQEATSILRTLGVSDVGRDIAALTSSTGTLLKTATLEDQARDQLRQVHHKLQRLSTLFEWHDGPLIHSMRRGDVFLLDEISLADDSVLERLNSVLEPGRTLVLAERGGDELDLPCITASEAFKLVATMNPGGDYGKKELSPALRNRFTEIWVPSVDNQQDLRQIVENLWKHNELLSYTDKLLGFTQWLGERAADPSIISLRDILAWVEFSNVVYSPRTPASLSTNQVFHHAAQLTFLDGLGSLPQLSSYSHAAIEKLRTEAQSKLQEIAPIDVETVPHFDPNIFFQLGAFAIPRGLKPSIRDLFSFQAPTTQNNVSRVVRGCQLPKPILLEGSPGVGKTSLVSALANACGFELCRINLSDQTDLVDLFGSDLPVEGGGPGQFAWRDAEFLRAMREGHWVLLDEMNLAPQAILEGLNAVLDHRGSVFIPELGRTFERHPSFRIFAAQNPIHQGGGRKGLPKSFMNRFTKVYVQELSTEDVFIICCNLFPEISPDIWQRMIEYTTRLHDEVMVRRSFGRLGTPWEFNLRDLIRWGTLIKKAGTSVHPSQFLNAVFLQRFRTSTDRNEARRLFNTIFTDSQHDDVLRSTITPNCIQFGCFVGARDGFSLGKRPGRLLRGMISSLEAVGLCTANSWLTVLTGPHDVGKSMLVRTLAHLQGRVLREVAVSSATDASDILGSFEEVDTNSRASDLLGKARDILDRYVASLQGSKSYDLLRAMDTHNPNVPISAQLTSMRKSLIELGNVVPLDTTQQELLTGLSSLMDHPNNARFEWVDGPLVTALKQGHWVLLDGANLCNPSVLDRLNSLCETDGVLALNERGPVDGSIQILKPHPNFRLFMSVDAQYGELSRAMRNRGLEVALLPLMYEGDRDMLWDFVRVPCREVQPRGDGEEVSLPVRYELVRRGCSGMEPLPSASKGIGREIPPSQLVDDSGSDSLITLLPILRRGDQEGHASLLHFIAHSTPLELVALLQRYLSTLVDPEPVWASLRSLLHAISGSRVVALDVQERNVKATSRSVPLELLSAQPLDLDLSHLLPSTRNVETTPLATLLRLFVQLQIIESDHRSPHVQKPIFAPNQAGSKLQERIINASSQVITSILDIAHALRDSIDMNSPTAETTLESIILLTSLAHHLTNLTTTSPLNHTSIFALSSWLSETLPSLRSPLFDPVRMHIISFAAVLALTSGRGITELWAGFSPGVNRVIDRGLVARFESLALGAEVSVRKRLLEQMALNTLPFETSALKELPSGIEKDKDTDDQNHQSEDPFLVIAESRLLGHIDALHDTLPLIQDRILIATEDPTSPLSRLVSYNHLVWAAETRQESIPITTTLYLEWLRALWVLPLVAGASIFPAYPLHSRLIIYPQIHGPSLLFMPTQLRGILQLCRREEQTLASLDAYEGALGRRMRMLGMALGKESRMACVRRMLSQATLMVSSPFLPQQEGTGLRSATISGLIEVIEGSSNSPLVNAFRDNLLSPLQSLSSVLSTGNDALLELGHSWIGLSRMLLDLFVPNIPIDPAALQIASSEFWSKELDILVSHLGLQKDLEVRISGTGDNKLTRRLEGMIEGVRSRIPIASGTPATLMRSTSQVQTYWSEVDQFLQQVLPAHRISSLLSSVGSDNHGAESREEVIQESIAAFCQRLRTAYPEFDDITKPLELALQFFRFGLRLVMHSVLTSRNGSPPSIDSTLALSLSAFPLVKSAELLGSETNEVSATLSTADIILAKLSAIALQTLRGADISDSIHEIDRLYEQALGLWLIDQARREKSQLEANSLYRGATAQQDETEEEKEFLEVFPEFEDLLAETEEKERSSALLTDTLSSKMAEVHQVLFAKKGERTNVELFSTIRHELLRTLVEARFSDLGEGLDEHSIPSQVEMLTQQIASVGDVHNTLGTTYDFYHDANIPEIRKALTVVSQLCSRLKALTQEWPDQMVLHHLITRCEAVLGLRITTPIAMVLAALEQLLLQSEDWEAFANRENSIKSFQQSIVALIVEWRRLELASWQGLLAREARGFSSGVAQWWFRLYEVAVRGVVNAAEGLEEEEGDGLSKFLEDVVPLVDEYLNNSPLGQYQSRLHLLRCFEAYVEKLAQHRTGRAAAALKRTHKVLHCSRVFFSQFEAKVATSLSDQRSAIEKDIKAVIKLASWRDINVHALKQSAQRSHKQLYKCIRKFRDVLRQPVSALLLFDPRHQDKQDTRNASSHVDIQPTSVAQLPSPAPRDSLPRHLVNLDSTYRNFGAIVKEQILPGIAASSPADIESFSVEIITTVQQLSNAQIPSSGDSDQRKKLLKHVLTRKRKAWSDLLKELKRSGLRANVRPDVLQQQQNIRWLREQPVLLCNREQEHVDLEKAENYLARLLRGLPALREALPAHHSDLPTRDIQRGTMFLESALSVTLHCRSSLSKALFEFEEIRRMTSRFEELSTCPSIESSGDEVIPYVSNVKYTVCGLVGSLREVLGHLDKLGTVLSDDLVAKQQDEINDRVRQLDLVSLEVSAIVEKVKSTSYPILTNSEFSTISSALQETRAIGSDLGRWSDECPRLHQFYNPVRLWITERQDLHPLQRIQRDFPARDDSAIESLLRVLQTLLERRPNGLQNPDTADPPDNYLSDRCISVSSTTLGLNLNTISNVLTETFQFASTLPSERVEKLIGRLLPFLQTFSSLTSAQISIHANWLKSLFKLDFVLCSLLSTLTKEGFCQPKDVEEEEGGGEGEGEMVEGSGLGEGTGNENVSKEIQEESQVEGLQGDSMDQDQDQDGDVERAEEGNAIEMSEDFGGKMQDVPDTQSADGEGDEDDEDESALDPEEQLGKLDDLDETAIDEKLWGDEEGKQGEEDESKKKSNQDQSKQEGGESDIVAKEQPGEESRSKEESKKNDKEQANDENAEAKPEVDEPQGDEEMPTEDVGTNGLPMDEHIPEADTLDLPDDLDMDTTKDQDLQNQESDHEFEDDADMDEDIDPTGAQDNLIDEDHEMADDQEADTENNMATDVNPEVSQDDAEQAVAQADVHGGGGTGGGNSGGEPEPSTESMEAQAEENGQQLDGNESVSKQNSSDDQNGDKPGEDQEPRASESEPAQIDQGDSSTGSGTAGMKRSANQPASSSKPQPDAHREPIRKLGDILREVMQNHEEIIDADPELGQGPVDPTAPPSQLEYLQQDESVEEMQALGPAGQEEVAKLRELKLSEKDGDDSGRVPPMDIDGPEEAEPQRPDRPSDHNPKSLESTSQVPEGVEGALNPADIKRKNPSPPTDTDTDTPALPSSIPSPSSHTHQLDLTESALKTWQLQGHPSSSSEHIWHLYESLTHDLSYALCEQLRLILEPTLATRLKGDYRTGKRLNMKKIIPYIASEYTKDKIWLRRTKPSQREYQVLLALDDSRSMAESHSVHLAYQTLGLVARALGRLEVGDVAIAKFGERVEVVRGFESGGFTDQAGRAIVEAFRFDQKATQVLSLLETSLTILERAREQKAMSSSAGGSCAADLWQLEIIISDGICQDHERLRTVLRRAEEQRVMVVFIVLDSLHVVNGGLNNTTTGQARDQNSILSMNQVSYKEVDGRMDLVVSRYLDTFPFEYYVVVRDVESLPEILSSTLKQFFERISEE